MDWFNIIKTNYEKGLYTTDQLDVFVDRGKITQAQKEQISGDIKHDKRKEDEHVQN